MDEDGDDLFYDEDLEPLREYEDDLQNSPLPGGSKNNAENAGDHNNLSFSRQENQDDGLVKDVVKVVKVNKAKVSYYFTERIPDMQTFFEQGEIELRITLGKNWDNYIAVNKTPLLKMFKNYQFNRSSETHYSRNVMLFSDNLEGMNLRLTLGVALDK